MHLPTCSVLCNLVYFLAINLAHHGEDSRYSAPTCKPKCIDYCIARGWEPHDLAESLVHELWVDNAMAELRRSRGSTRTVCTYRTPRAYWTVLGVPPPSKTKNCNLSIHFEDGIGGRTPEASMSR